jgi:hypothetical protein
MVVIGIDPGLNGGIAFIDEGKNCHAFPLPYNDNKRLNPGELQKLIMEEFYDWFEGYHARFKEPNHPWATVYVERQFIRGRQKGALAIGENYGRIMATLELLGEMPVKEVRPVDWKGMLPSREKGQTEKDVSIQYCLDREYEIPTLKPRGKILHDGIADAICIALYGWEEIEAT